jgi:lipoprotein-anchoring transpeptidase ErfK/SrfK
MRFRILVFLTAIFLVIASYGAAYQGRVNFLSSQGNIQPESLSGFFDSKAKLAFYNNQLLALSDNSQGKTPQRPKVLGEAGAHKRIEVDLTNQRLYAYEDNRLIYNFLISSGLWGRTPTGRFEIWIKLRYSKMEGGSKLLNTYYYLPNVPYVMYFYNDEVPKYRGFGIHGTYWHDNFGHPMSHGCINMKTEEVALLYEWAKPASTNEWAVYSSAENPGTEIIIYGQAPWN